MQIHVLLQAVLVRMPVFVPVADIEGLPSQLPEFGHIFIPPRQQCVFVVCLSLLHSFEVSKMQELVERVLTHAYLQQPDASDPSPGNLVV